MARQDSDELEPIDGNQVISDMTSMLSVLYKSNGVILELQPHAVHPVFLGVAGKLQQIIINLVNNAKDAMKDSKIQKVTIETLNFGNEYIIKIEDTGGGIPKNVLGRIFDSFYTTKPMGEGTGIGLSLVAQFVNEMSGTINVKSEMGEGTTFTLTFPTTDKKPENLENDHSNSSLYKSLAGNILVVEDEPYLNELVCESLRHIGLNVMSAKNGKQALKFLEVYQYEYLLLDLKMPVMSGKELLIQLEKRAINIPTIVMTGGITTKLKTDQMPACVKFNLIKPFGLSELFEALKYCNLNKSTLGFSGTKETEEVLGRILMADDEVELLKVYAGFITNYGYSVETALDGESVFKLLEKEEFDLLVTDLNMPGISGMELLKQVKLISGNTKVIVMTGDFHTSFEQAYGQDFYKIVSEVITKPFSSKDLLNLIQNTIVSKSKVA